MFPVPFKEQIESLDASCRADLAERLLALRPMSFRYRPEVAGVDDPPLGNGLIAEEVAVLFLERVVLDTGGRPSVVRYHQLIPLLLDGAEAPASRLRVARARLGAIDGR